MDFLTIVHSKHKYANILLKLKEKKDNLLFGLLVANNALNITASALNVFITLDLAEKFNVDTQVLASITTFGLMFIVIIFAEAIPKIVGLRFKYKL